MSNKNQIYLSVQIKHLQLLLDSFIKRVDEALYKAKNSGRNQVILYQ